MSATEAPARPISRELLEDRWDGLMYDGVMTSKTQERMWRLLREVVVGVSRRNEHPETGLFGGHDLESELSQVLRQAVISRVDDLGLAR